MKSKTKFDFDDILIVPKTTTKITSRYRDVELSQSPLPLITAPMDTVVDLYNMNQYVKNDIMVALPRTVKLDDYLVYVNKFGIQNPNTFISFGFEDIEYHLEYSMKLIYNGAHILIDVANGHMEKIVGYCKKIKHLRPDIIIMVGNIGNPDTYLWYAQNNCVDYVRVGIGNGGGCITTKQSGIGYPMASLIYETRKLKDLYMKGILPSTDNKIKVRPAPEIVADGGMKDHSDIIKALGLGADYVMIGSIFNKALESSGSNYLWGIKINHSVAKFLYKKGFPIKKYFRGMSTKQAQKAMGKTHFKTSEGVVRYRKVEYLLGGWVENFEHYLRNAMSYSNATNLEEFIGKTEICKISENAYKRFNK